MKQDVSLLHTECMYITANYIDQYTTLKIDLRIYLVNFALLVNYVASYVYSYLATALFMVRSCQSST